MIIFLLSTASTAIPELVYVAFSVSCSS
jgi:hypothetical protein